MKKKIGRFISVFLAVCLSIGSISFTSFAEEIDDEITEQEEVFETFSSGSTYEYVNDGYKVIYTLNDIWDGGYNLGVVIQNIGDDAITDWAAQIPFDDEITSSWGIEEISNESGILRFKNLGWNSDIYAHQSVSFGIIANGQFDAFPETFTFLGNSTEAHLGLDVSLSIPQQWDGGFNGFLEITNNTEEDYSNWQIEFDYNNEIITFWDAKIVSHDGNHYVVKPYENTGDFVIGQTVSYGFQVHEGDSSEEISNVIITTTEPEIPAEQIDDEEWITNGSYFKTPSAEDIVYDEENDETYVRNQLVIGVMLGIDKKLVKDMASYYGATIVGYISKMEMYQFEFNSEKSYSELEDLIDEIESYSFVTYAILNYAETVEEEYYPSEGSQYSWNVQNDKTWGLESLFVPGAWDYRTRFQGAVKVGVLDNRFMNNHPDLTIKKIINNSFLVTPSGDEISHGTHVSGTIGATFDNGVGISGVATNVDIYGYCVNNVLSYIDFVSASSQYAELIYNNVKVINVSRGYLANYQVQVYYGNQSTIKKLEKSSRSLAKNLENLVLSGYDFLIVNSAGNGSDRYYNSHMELVDSSSPDIAYHVVEQDAQYNSCVSGITDEFPLVKSRILVVGATRYEVDSNGVTNYYVTDFSARGNRVDVYAPGQNIYSTVMYETDSSGYHSFNGTSMAAPHITGIAALIWQANPYLTAPEVKNIIVNCRGNSVTDLTHPGLSLYMPDATMCVKTALGEPGGINISNNDMPKGTVKGKVVDGNGSALHDISIYFVRTSSGEANLKDYYYTSTTNAFGEYEFTVPIGEYELLACSSSGLYLPVTVRNISVDPDYTRYLEDIILVDIPEDYVWGSSAVVSGTVYNAITGAPIPNATIHSRTNWNSIDGRYCLGETISDSTGYFELPLESLGNYTIEVKAPGYITGYFNVVGVLDTVGVNQSIVLTPVLSDDEYRIILTWDDDPRDLDSHLTYDRGVGELMHVFFGNRNGYLNGNLVASLDLDDTSGYGPETITMTLNASDLSNGGCFTYYVHKFSGNEELRQSSAIVRLYSGNTLLETYYVPDAHGNNWYVFRITDAGVENINRIS